MLYFIELCERLTGQHQKEFNFLHQEEHMLYFIELCERFTGQHQKEFNQLIQSI